MTFNILTNHNYSKFYSLIIHVFIYKVNAIYYTPYFILESNNIATIFYLY